MTNNFIIKVALDVEEGEVTVAGPGAPNRDKLFGLLTTILINFWLSYKLFLTA